MKRSKSYVHFSFTGEFDPDEITKEIGVSPTLFGYVRQKR